ncbi:unnamed protein product [Polarella glacialis]|uniref:Mannosylglycerate hydrolase MGH1-like glycoside hydrolase domain-containing protein n=1 Tax=Polarella glacialis TaxID=89957 RepID=A0A813I1U4_POLGL|nr:unnamed protein product [Polarella glacialis]
MYTSWFAWATWQRHMVVGSVSFIKDVFPDLLENARMWTKTHRGQYGGRACYWQDEGYDAMEVSISSSGCRPTINSVMFGEAVALLGMAKLIGNSSVEDELRSLQEETRRFMLEQMWNPRIQSFAVIPLPGPSSQTPFRQFTPHHPHCPGNGSASWPQNETVGARELLAFMPWYFSLPTASGGQLIPPSEVAKFETMWPQLFDEQGFAARWGLRTAELRSPCYNFSYEHSDCWNGRPGHTRLQECSLGLPTC